jgi:hypothetical protein
MAKVKKTVLFLLTVILMANVQLVAQNAALNNEEQNYLKKGYRVDKNGWIFLHLEGQPYEIGFQRGYLIAKEINDFRETEKQYIKFTTSRDYAFFIKKAAQLFKGKITKEYVAEMQGMAAGMAKAGQSITYDEILFLNGYIDLVLYWWPAEKDKEKEGKPGCSAFIATGKQTADGKIVMAHNTWGEYADGQFCNIMIDLTPATGNRILMQSWGPLLYSGTDFFITGAGLMGTETTIDGFKGFDKKGTPVFERARTAMQYANSIDEWANIMIEKNNGSYANSWLIGDTKTNEIARLELGLKYHSLEKTKDGYYAGSNITTNPQILNDEANEIFEDIRNCCVARQVRWKQLMKDYYGKIGIENAKQLLADHYDPYLEIDKPCLRSICGHADLDDGQIPNTMWTAFNPSGAFDGKVVNSEMAKNWQMWAKWGHPCGISFEAAPFLDKHPQFDWQKGYLKDIPSFEWTIFPPIDGNK